jgi:glycosyltransferase involved in cell wall biosynthesis
MAVQKKVTEDPTVDGPGGFPGAAYDVLRRKLDTLPVRRYRGRDTEMFSPAWLPELRRSDITRRDPDITHLHWIAGGFLRPSTIGELRGPLIWTLHDMWPFTGGCHYTRSCTRYQDRCGECPQLDSGNPDDLSRSVWERKREAWRDISMTAVAPSRWLAECAEESSLFADVPIEVIPNGLDTESFRPRESAGIRSQLGLGETTRIVCFGADWSTRRKGTDLLFEALEEIDTARDSVQVVAFGREDPETTADTEVPIQYLGFLQESVLRKLYSEADVMVVPSRQEAFGQTASEALASGTPVVAFDATGPRDIVDHEQTGYLADPFDPSSLAEGIDWVLADEQRRRRLGERAREAALDRFSIDVVAREYRALYDDVR